MYVLSLYTDQNESKCSLLFTTSITLTRPCCLLSQFCFTTYSGKVSQKNISLKLVFEQTVKPCRGWTTFMLNNNINSRIQSRMNELEDCFGWFFALQKALAIKGKFSSNSRLLAVLMTAADRLLQLTWSSINGSDLMGQSFHRKCSHQIRIDTNLVI